MGKRDVIIQAALDRCPADLGTPSHTKVPCGYIMGATGWVCTQARLDAQAKQYPAYAAKIRQYGPRWLGKKCYDCAQLVRVCALAAGYKMVSGANSQWTKTDWAETGTIDTLPQDSRGLFLYRLEGGRAKHTAVCIGDGTEAEAMGHAYGVVRCETAKRTFTHWARLPGLDGDEGRPTLKTGSRGEYVRTMQNLLTGAGCELPKYGADGVFGAETETALKVFQGLNALPVDGVCGKDTWAALIGYEEPEADTGEEAPAIYTITIPGLTGAQADGLLAAWPRATKAVG